MIISFGWTAAALLAREKTSTLREWDDRYAARFRKGQVVDAWDRSPRAHGHKIGTLELTEAPELIQVRDLRNAHELHWVAEGFAYFHQHPEHMPKTIWGHKTTGWDFSAKWFAEWIDDNGDRPFWLVKFQILELTP